MSDKNYYSLLKIDSNKYLIDHIYQSNDYLEIYIIKKKDKFYVCNNIIIYIKGNNFRACTFGFKFIIHYLFLK